MIPQAIAGPIAGLAFVGLILFLIDLNDGKMELLTKSTRVTIVLVLAGTLIFFATGSIVVELGETRAIEVEGRQYEYKTAEDFYFIFRRATKLERIKLFEENNMLGCHPLKEQVYEKEVSGDFEAHHLAGTSGIIEENSVLKFTWFLTDQEKEMLNSKFPASKVKRIFSEEIDKPEVRFLFKFGNFDWKDESTVERLGRGVEPEDLISSKYVKRVIIRVPDSYKSSDF